MNLSDKTESSLPTELLDFLRAPGGHSLILKGDAGTGKTTLALQIIEELTDDQPEYYLSMRVSDEGLFNQFPWLREKMRQNRILIAGKAFLRTTWGAENIKKCESRDSVIGSSRSLLSALNEEGRAPLVERRELQKLEGQIEAGEIGYEDGEEMSPIGSDGTITLEIGRLMPEVELAYDIVENNLPKRSLVILDSIEALSETYGINPLRIINTLQKDLVENANTNIMYILEHSEKGLMDYLGDGIVQLQSREFEGRRVRELVIEKLRGSKILNWKYLFTLKEGRIRVLQKNVDFSILNDRKHDMIDDPTPTSISSGCNDFDSIFQGLARGGLSLLEIGKDVHPDFVQSIEMSLVANQLMRGRGVIWFPEYGMNMERFQDILRTKIPNIDSSMKGLNLLDPANISDSRFPFIKPVEGANVDNDMRLDTLRYFLSDSNPPHLSILGIDAMESIYGDDMVSGLWTHIDAMRRGNHIVLAEATEASASLGKLSHQAKLHLKVDILYGTLIIYGKKPMTPFYSLELNPEGDGILMDPII